MKNAIERIVYLGEERRPVVPHRYLRQAKFNLCETHLRRAEKRWPEGVPLDGPALAAAEAGTGPEYIGASYALRVCLQSRDRIAVARFVLRRILLSAEKVAVKADRGMVAKAMALPVEDQNLTDLQRILRPLAEACPEGKAKNRLEAAAGVVTTLREEGGQAGCFTALAWASVMMGKEELTEIYSYAVERFIAREAKDRREEVRRPSRRKGAE